jgi:hypothetical protein
MKIRRGADIKRIQVKHLRLDSESVQLFGFDNPRERPRTRMCMSRQFFVFGWSGIEKNRDQN